MIRNGLRRSAPPIGGRSHPTEERASQRHARGRAAGLRQRRCCALAAAVGLTTVVGAGEGRAQGALVQLEGTTGCVSENGSGGNCADGLALGGAQGLALPSNGLHLYVAASASDGVAAFVRNPATGGLTQLVGTDGCVTELGNGGLCGDGRALLGARDVVLSANGKSLYVAAPGSDAVAVFERNPSTGVLVQLAGTAGCVSETGTGGACADGVALNGARSVAVAANGKHAYVAARDSDAVASFARDKATGALTQLPGSAACVSENGTGGLCVNGVALDFPTSVAVTRDGKHVYVAAAGSHAVAAFARDRSTGALTQLPGLGACASEDGTGGLCADGRGLLGAFALAISKDGRSVYVASRDGSAIAVFAREKSTGVLTQLAGAAGCISEDGSGGLCADGVGLVGVVSVAVSNDRSNVYAAAEGSNAVAAFLRDKRTGALTQLPGAAACTSEDGTGGLCADGTALVEARAVAVTRNGRSAYVASSTSDAVAAFARD